MLTTEVSKDKIESTSDGIRWNIAIMVARSYLLDKDSRKVSREVFIEGVSKAYGFKTELIRDAFQYIQTTGLNLLSNSNGHQKNRRGQEAPKKGRTKSTKSKNKK